MGSSMIKGHQHLFASLCTMCHFKGLSTPSFASMVPTPSGSMTSVTAVENEPTWLVHRRNSNFRDDGSVTFFELEAKRNALEALATSTKTAGYEQTTTQTLGLRALAPPKLLRDLVDLVGIEPTTSSMPWKRAPSCATGPR